MSYKRFNRHECYSSEMLSMNGEVVRELQDIAIEQGKSMFDMSINMTCGLYDGYLYDDLLQEVTNFGASESTLNKVKGLIKAIEMYIQLYGETENGKMWPILTQIHLELHGIIVKWVLGIKRQVNLTITMLKLQITKL